MTENYFRDRLHGMARPFLVMEVEGASGQFLRCLVLVWLCVLAHLPPVLLSVIIVSLHQGVLCNSLNCSEAETALSFQTSACCLYACRAW